MIHPVGEQEVQGLVRDPLGNLRESAFLGLDWREPVRGTDRRADRSATR